MLVSVVKDCDARLDVLPVGGELPAQGRERLEASVDVVEVDAEPVWRQPVPWGRIARVGNLVFTGCACVQRLRVTAGRVEEIEWQEGEDVLTWTRGCATQ